MRGAGLCERAGAARRGAHDRVERRGKLHRAARLRSPVRDRAHHVDELQRDRAHLRPSLRRGLVSMTEVSQVQSQVRQAQAAILAIQQRIVGGAGGTSSSRRARSGSGGAREADRPARHASDPRGPAIHACCAGRTSSRPSRTWWRRMPRRCHTRVVLPEHPADRRPGLGIHCFRQLFTGPASLWLGEDIAGPIFTFGGISGQVHPAEAAQRMALEGYRQTILNAFRETNDALAGSQNCLAESNEQVARWRRCANSRDCRNCASTRASPATSTWPSRRTSLAAELARRSPPRPTARSRS